jgi:hypothetical protein
VDLDGDAGAGLQAGHAGADAKLFGRSCLDLKKVAEIDKKEIKKRGENGPRLFSGTRCKLIEYFREQDIGSFRELSNLIFCPGSVV